MQNWHPESYHKWLGNLYPQPTNDPDPHSLSSATWHMHHLKSGTGTENVVEFDAPCTEDCVPWCMLHADDVREY